MFSQSKEDVYFDAVKLNTVFEKLSEANISKLEYYTLAATTPLLQTGVASSDCVPLPQVFANLEVFFTTQKNSPRPDNNP